MKTEKITTIKSGYFTWYDIEKPEEEEFKFLRRRFHFHPLDIQDCLSPVQRPKIDEYDRYIFLIARLPYYEKEENVIHASELDIFIGSNFLVTLHEGKISTLKEFVQECKNYKKCRENYLPYGGGYLLYEVLNRMFQRSYPMLDIIAREIDQIEDRMFKNPEENMVEKIANIKRNIINFHRIMRAHRPVMKKIMESNKFFLNLNGAQQNNKEILYDDLMEEIENIWDVLETHAETIAALDKTYDTLISHRLNKIMKTLTILSSILLPATLITQFFGISFGGITMTTTWWGIGIIILLMIFASTTMLIYFKKRRWL